MQSHNAAEQEFTPAVNDIVSPHSAVPLVEVQRGGMQYKDQWPTPQREVSVCFCIYQAVTDKPTMQHQRPADKLVHDEEDLTLLSKTKATTVTTLSAHAVLLRCNVT